MEAKLVYGIVVSQTKVLQALDALDAKSKKAIVNTDGKEDSQPLEGSKNQYKTKALRFRTELAKHGLVFLHDDELTQESLEDDAIGILGGVFARSGCQYSGSMRVFDANDQVKKTYNDFVAASGGVLTEVPTSHVHFELNE